MSDSTLETGAIEQPETMHMSLAMTFWGTVSIAVFCAVVVLTIGLSAYHFLAGANSKERFAIVDLPGVLELQQLHLYQRLNDPKTNEAAKQALFSDAQRFGAQLEAALVQTKKDCKCILLVKSAVVLPDLPDVTPAIAQALGLGGLNLQDLRQSLQKNLSMPDLQAKEAKP